MTTNVVKIEIKALKVKTNKVINPVIKIKSLLLVMFRKFLISIINFDDSISALPATRLIKGPIVRILATSKRALTNNKT